MKLIDILVRELPKRGGWPSPYVDTVAVQDYDYEIKFCLADCVLKFELNNPGLWGSNSSSAWLDPCQSFTPESISHDYESSKVTREQYEAALASSKQEWNGDGLPPVGARCEFISNDTSWGEVDVIGIDGDKVVFKPSGETYYGIAPSQRQIFRPVRSEADKKRDEAIEALVEVYRNSLGDVTGAFGCIYDAIVAGKIPGVKLED